MKLRACSILSLSTCSSSAGNPLDICVVQVLSPVQAWLGLPSALPILLEIEVSCCSLPQQPGLCSHCQQFPSLAARLIFVGSLSWVRRPAYQHTSFEGLKSMRIQCQANDVILASQGQCMSKWQLANHHIIVPGNGGSLKDNHPMCQQALQKLQCLSANQKGSCHGILQIIQSHLSWRMTILHLRDFPSQHSWQSPL